VAHAEVIGIDNEQPGVFWVSKFLRGASFVAWCGHLKRFDKSKLRSNKEKGPPRERPFFGAE
jgi:hypothetical protein